ncbi:MAG TPA: NAD-dependent epimerase/dehydratase family protein, partial [Gemmatimonadaceae bacterium]|nr:NAD-dependent epimerase/dehydratase family protein [Gemmatimonadaceae bacterium]
EGWGISVDAVIADFIAGAAERLTLDAAKDADIVLVEGQGSLVHPGYSGVTYGLMQGSLPHAMVMCAQPSRTAINNNPWVKIPPLRELIDFHERALAPLRPSKTIAVALNTFDLSEARAREAIARAEDETGLPATDPVRFDPAPVVDAIEQFHASRARQAAARI